MKFINIGKVAKIVRKEASDRTLLHTCKRIM